MPLTFAEVEIQCKPLSDETGLRSDGELVQAVADSFEFTSEAQEETALVLPAVLAHPDHVRSHDTPFDDQIPKEFRAEDVPPPPYDIDVDAAIFDVGQFDLIAWALDQIA